MTLTIELLNSNALKSLKDLEHQHLIRIVEMPELTSYSLPGQPMSVEEFKSWVEYAEDSPSVDLNEAKQRWSTQKEKLRKLTS
jgi:hypothetical protein